MKRPPKPSVARLRGLDTHRDEREVMAGTIRSPKVRQARALAKRALRERSRLFLAEGPQAVREALGYGHGGCGITELFVTAAARSRHAELVGAVEAAGAPVHQVSAEVMAELA